MAVVAVAINNVTRVNNADALGTLWQDLGGGATNNEPDFFYQGTASVSEKVKTSEAGVKYYNSATSHAFSTNDRTWIAKHLASNKDALNVEGSTGGILDFILSLILLCMSQPPSCTVTKRAPASTSRRASNSRCPNALVP